MRPKSAVELVMTDFPNELGRRHRRREARRRLGTVMSPQGLGASGFGGFGLALIALALRESSIDLPECVANVLVVAGFLIVLASIALFFVGDRPNDRKLISEQIDDGHDLQAVVRFNFDEKTVRVAYMAWQLAAYDALRKAGLSAYSRQLRDTPPPEGTGPESWREQIDSKLSVLEEAAKQL